jgi:hypothetical protein
MQPEITREQNLQPKAVRIPFTISRWFILVVILIAAFLVRLALMFGKGYSPDLECFQYWINVIQDHGILPFYNYPKPNALTYPPVSTLLMKTTLVFQQILIAPPFTLDNPRYVFSLKWVPVAADLLLIAVSYFWLHSLKTSKESDNHRQANRLSLTALLPTIIPLILAFSPLLLIDSAWWGQYDSVYSALIVLTLIALNRDKPIAAWMWFAVALLAKQQSLVVSPLLIILTYRRYGWRTTLRGIVTCGIIMLLLYAPFILTSGPVTALEPFLGATGVHINLSANAFNFWWLVSRFTGIAADNQPVVFGVITSRHLGFVLLGSYTLIIVLSIWKGSAERREFVWAAALYFGTFNFLTQMHERYLVSGIILAVIGIIQDRRLWIVALIGLLAISYNMIQIAITFRWFGLDAWPASDNIVASFLNVTLALEILYVSATLPSTRLNQTNIGVKALVLVNRVFLAVQVVGAGLYCLSSNIEMYRTANWITQNVSAWENIGVENDTELTLDTTLWWPNYFPLEHRIEYEIEKKSVLDWYGRSVHYLLISETMTPSNLTFEERIKALEAQGAQLAYISQPISVPSLNIARQAILRTFRPQNTLNISFDNVITLFGYDVLHDNNQISLMFYWHATTPQPLIYNRFIHAIDSDGNEISLQPDSTVGRANRTTNFWKKGDIVFDTVPLDVQALAKIPAPYQLLIGLYTSDGSGRRAIVQGDGDIVAGSMIKITIQADSK